MPVAESLLMLQLFYSFFHFGNSHKTMGEIPCINYNVSLCDLAIKPRDYPTIS